MKSLSELCDPSRSVSYGIVQPGKPQAGGIPIVRVNNFKGHRLDLNDVLRVGPGIEAAYRRSRPRPNDVLISLVGSIGQVSIAPIDIAGWNLARAVGLIPMSDRHHAEWVFYALQSPDAQRYIWGHANTTVQATFNLKDLARLPIPYPDSSTRENIVEILGSLDDKIELNRRMNETLEAMAQAIFRDWFVDFGPTRRKIDGATDPVEIMGGLVADPDRARELARLFPASIGDDGLPEGWKMRAIYSEANVIYGAPFASKRFNTMGIGRPLARIRDLPNHRGGLFTEERHSKEYIIRPGDIVVGMDGEFRAYLWHGVDTLMNQRVCCFAPIELENRAFVYFSIKPLLERSENSAVGTTVIHLGKKDIDRFVVVNPGTALKAAFAAIAQPLMARLVANGEQIRTLTATRDLLLPKLMSGEIRLDEAPAQAEAAE